MKKIGDIIPKETHNMGNTVGNTVRNTDKNTNITRKLENTDATRNLENTARKRKRAFFDQIKKMRRSTIGRLPLSVDQKSKSQYSGGNNYKLLKNLRHWLLLFTVFLLPLWFLPWGTDKIGLAKQLLMTILVGTGFLLWLYENMSKGKIVYRKSAVNIGAWLLLLVVTISAIFSLDPITSFFASSANFANLWNFILLGIFYLLVMTDNKDKEYKGGGLLNVFLVSVGLVTLYTLLNIFGVNLFKNILNPVGTVNSVAILAGLAFVIILGRIMGRDKGTKEETKGHKGILVGILLLSVVFIFLTNFTPVWYGLILGAILLIIAKIRREKDAQIKSFSLPMAVLVVSLVFVFWGSFGARIGIEQPQINLKNLPTEVYPTFKTSLAIADKTLNQKNNLERMFFGVGSGNFNKMWLLHRPLDLNQTDFWQTRFSQSYSSFTTWIIETGYTGLITIAILFVLLLWRSVKKKQESLNELDNIYLPISIAYLILTWFLYSFNLTLYFALFFLIALMVKKNPKKSINFSKPIQKALMFSLCLLLAMVGIVFAGYFCVQRYISSVYIAKGAVNQVIDSQGLNQEELIAKAQEELSKKINLLARAYNLDKSNDEALRNISQLYLNKINLALQNKEKDISTLVQSALIAATKAVETNKAEYLNYMNLAQTYEELIALASDAYGFAIDNYDKALALNSNDPSPILGMATSRFSEAVRVSGAIDTLKTQGEKDQAIQQQEKLLEEAIQKLGEAIKLKINYTPAHQLLAQIYDIQGKIDEAIVSTSNLVILNPQDAGLWFQLGLLHYKNNDIAKAEMAFSQAIALKEDYSNARYFIGLVYATQDRSDEAIVQFERVTELNPNSQEVKTILENLRSGREALEGVVPPAQAPENREKAPIE